MKRGLVIGAGALLVGAAVALLWTFAGADPEPPVADTEPRGEAPRFPDIAPYEFFREGEEAIEAASASRDDGERRGGMRFDREEWAQLSAEERRARRREMRERWRNMSPEEREERFAARAARRVRVEALGDEEPEIEPVEVMRSMREVRPQIRECIDQNGGWRAFREAATMVSPDAGAGGRRRMTVSLAVSASGQVGEIALNPPPPEPFGACFTSALANLRLPPPNAEARVEVQLGRGGRRRGREPGPRRGDDERATMRR